VRSFTNENFALMRKSKKPAVINNKKFIAIDAIYDSPLGVKI
jgi:hypothetical protein